MGACQGMRLGSWSGGAEQRHARSGAVHLYRDAHRRVRTAQTGTALPHRDEMVGLCTQRCNAVWSSPLAGSGADHASAIQLCTAHPRVQNKQVNTSKSERCVNASPSPTLAHLLAVVFLFVICYLLFIFHFVGFFFFSLPISPANNNEVAKDLHLQGFVFLNCQI
jgi:hypothetical protein